jgi:hypothetical protein
VVVGIEAAGGYRRNRYQVIRLTSCKVRPFVLSCLRFFVFRHGDGRTIRYREVYRLAGSGLVEEHPKVLNQPVHSKPITLVDILCIFTAQNIATFLPVLELLYSFPP